MNKRKIPENEIKEKGYINEAMKKKFAEIQARKKKPKNNN